MQVSIAETRAQINAKKSIVKTLSTRSGEGQSALIATGSKPIFLCRFMEHCECSNYYQNHYQALNDFSNLLCY